MCIILSWVCYSNNICTWMAQHCRYVRIYWAHLHVLDNGDLDITNSWSLPLRSSYLLQTRAWYQQKAQHMSRSSVFWDFSLSSGQVQLTQNLPLTKLYKSLEPSVCLSVDFPVWTWSGPTAWKHGLVNLPVRFYQLVKCSCRKEMRHEAFQPS